MSYQLHIGDSLDVLKTIPSNSIDSVVTDPPYGLEFMGKEWDKFTTRTKPRKIGNLDVNQDERTGIAAPEFRRIPVEGWRAFQEWCEQWAAECLRVLKPGGYLVAFGGTRTYHRLASGVEDAGFEIRDKLDWIYGSGFPKSLDVSKAIDKAAGADREVIGKRTYADGTTGHFTDADVYGAVKDGTQKMDTAPSTDAAKQWEGWGTALKPAHEPIVLARKPLSEKTVAANVLEHGTGGLNIDGSRVGTATITNRGMSSLGVMHDDDWKPNSSVESTVTGRWPPNILLSHSPYCTNIRQRRIEDPASWDCSEGCPVSSQSEIDSQGAGCVPSCPVKEMDRQSGISSSTIQKTLVQKAREDQPSKGGEEARVRENVGFNDTGGASRFFPIIEWDDESTVAYDFNFKYQAKAAKKERPSVDGVAAHPTVKPVALMRWLARLVTPPGGKVLDLFGGSGTTAEACELEGFDCTIIEREADYAKLIEARMAKYDTPKEVGLDGLPAETW